MNIRKIIQEEISKLFAEQEDSMFGGVLKNIGDELDTDLSNVDNIVKTNTTDLNNKDNEIKANLLLKSKLDSTSPQKKGLEIEIPASQKDYDQRKKQLQDLENAKKGMEVAKGEITKQKAEIDKQKTQQQLKTGKSQISSVLPSLPSPI